MVRGVFDPSGLKRSIEICSLSEANGNPTVLKFSFQRPQRGPTGNLDGRYRGRPYFSVGEDEAGSLWLLLGSGFNFFWIPVE